MNRPAAVLALALLAILSACESNTAEERLRTYLGLTVSTQLNEKTIREAFLRKIPLGTAAEDVERRLQEAGVGKDQLSSYIGPDATHKAVVRVDFDRQTIGVVKTRYEIPLIFSPELKLADLEVKIWRTGL